MRIIGTREANTKSTDRPVVRTEAYMRLQGEQTFETENYVSTPPALLVLEPNGCVWTLGFNRIFGPRGEFAFDVLVNGQWTGEWASRIERRNGRVRIFTCESTWKVWSGKNFI